MTFEAGTTKIAQELFTLCESLESIIIPNTVTKIEANAFAFCTSLREVVLPESLVSIGTCGFLNCTSLITLELPENLVTINSSAFDSCASLEKVIMPDSITKIYDSAFYGCAKLSDINLSKSLEFLGYGAFKGCKSLTSIEIPKSLKEGDRWNYQHGIFQNSGLKTVTFEDGTTKIAQELFTLCESLESITIPDTVTIVEQDAFAYCTSLKKVELSHDLENIQLRAFYYCTSLESMDLPDSITSMGTHVFYGCTSLEKVKLPNTRKNITECMFYNCKKLSEIVLPDTVTTIQASAFYGCTSLSTLALPDGLQTIQNNAFYENKALTEITIPENVTSIGSSAFYNCDALTKAEIKGSGSIGSQAFYDCDALESITIGDKVTSIGSSMCYSCDSLTDIKLGKGITTIPDSSFRLCSSLETVTIPRFCTSIAANAFAENTKLASAYVPVSVTSIQSNSFSYPAKMTMYGKEGSYAQEYANSREMAFVSVDQPITTIAYTESSMNIAYRATVLPGLQIIPDFDTDVVTFTSSDTSVATIAANGAVYGKGYGTAIITAATDSGLSASMTVNVIRPATSVTLNKTAIEISAGKSEVLTAAILPESSTDILEWTSDNTDVAVVDSNGVVTGVAKGTANITTKATFGGKTATCLVTVVDSDEEIVEVTGITLDAASHEITIGNQRTLTATVLPENATNKLVEWSSSNSSVAEVENGVIIAKSIGSAVITAKAVSGGYAATCNITVVPKVEITSFDASVMGVYALVSMAVVNAPDAAIAYIAAYGSDGKLVSVQNVAVSSAGTQTIIPITDVAYMKAFVWAAGNARPLAEIKKIEIK